jgi:cytochrome c556
MHKSKTFLASLLFASALTGMNAQAADMEEMIEARQGVMTLYGINMDILGDMIRSNRPYDKKLAQESADNLLALANMKNGMLWPRGSSIADPGMQGKTSAKPEIWQNMGDVSARHQDLTKALEVLAKNAAWSVDALEENIADVNSACKGCHKKYRSKK